MAQGVASTDPGFETKAARVVVPYLNPRQRAVVSCLQEETALQAPDHPHPVHRFPQDGSSVSVSTLPPGDSLSTPR